MSSILGFLLIETNKFIFVFRYLKAAPVGQRLLIEAKTNKVGRTLAFLDVVIKNKESGDLIATGSHTKFVGR